MSTSRFVRHYPGARRRFLQAANHAGARVRALTHPQSDSTGNRLATDVAVVGDQPANRALLVLSATHGLEGPAGSAVQSTWLERIAERIPTTGIRVILVHGVNPWGFAHQSRTTEENVDLNRNFVEFRIPLPDNPGYRELHPIVCPDRLDCTRLDSIAAELENYARQHGFDALTNGLGGGQYEFPDGLHFGGHSPSWSRNMLESIIREELVGIDKVGLIDWHTGRGDYGKPFFLCFSPPGGTAWNRAADWWGEAAIGAKDSISAAYGGDAPPPRTGLLFKGIEQTLGCDAQLTGAVIEFGTYPPDRVIRAELIDRALKFAQVDDSLRARLSDEMIEAFTPADQEWEAAVEESGYRITEQALAGLADW